MAKRLIQFGSEPSVERSFLLDENESEEALDEQILVGKLPENVNRKKRSDLKNKLF